MAARSSRSARTRRANRNRQGASPRPRRRWRRWLIGLLVVPAILLAAVGLLGFYLIFSSVPLPDDIEAQSSIVYDASGEEVGGLASEIDRQDVDLGTLPGHVPEAVLAAEDRSFYEHRGISATGIARALFTNVRSGSIRGGGSTITQQYIKNAALTPEQTYRRKVEEAALAIKLEQEYDKDEILNFYLNTAYWGRGTTGIEAASLAYFDTPASEVSVNQAATLAGLLPAPEAYDPFENPDRADSRRQYVLDGMLEEGYLTQAEHDDLVAEGLPEVSERGGIERGPNAYYVDAVRRELGARAEFAQGELFRGLRIFTELDQDMQAAAQETLTQAVTDGPTDTGAIVSIDPDTGGVRALVGGPDIDEQPFNTAVRSARQVGSTFKAFTLQGYLESEGTPSDSFDAPAELDIDDAQEPIRNFGGSSFGSQSVRQATASSTNTVYVRMQEEIGREAVIDAARRAGLPTDKSGEVFPTERESGDTMRPLAGLTLGQDGFSPLELTSAYATYPAEGYHVRPRLVVRIEDADGRVVHDPGPRDEQSVEVEVARTVTDVLTDVVTSGSGTAAALDERPVAGKTGTTSEGRDVWFSGYVPQLATSVWLGNLDNSPIDGEDATGGGLAAPVWSTYMARAVEGMEIEAFNPPSGEVETDDDQASCPDGYRFDDPPDSADEDGFFPDVLVDITDEDDRPCVEIKPDLDPCPPGFAYDVPPAGPDEFGRTPEVLDEPRDFQGRPCVEVLGEPEEPEEPEEPDEPEEQDEPEEPDEPDEPDEPEQPEPPDEQPEQPEGPAEPEQPEDEADESEDAEAADPASEAAAEEGAQPAAVEDG